MSQIPQFIGDIIYTRDCRSEHNFKGIQSRNVLLISQKESLTWARYVQIRGGNYQREREPRYFIFYDNVRSLVAVVNCDNVVIFHQGNRGRTGCPGAPGVDGLPGMPGKNGASGAPGMGFPGKNGVPGSPGLPGLPGSPGKNGVSGNPGMGFPGKDGLNGLPGSPGKNGLPGLPGSRGLDGLPGLPGSRGLDGLPGSPGKNGLNGSRGLPGLPGSRGLDGLPGLPGSRGLDGLPGLPGSRGLDGLPGLPGSRGLVGLPGSRGLDGLPGLPGSRGLVGLPGSRGLDGLPGLPGSRGLPGLPGSRGLNGIPGSPGKNGLSGAPGSPGISGAPCTNCMSGCTGLVGAYAYIWNTAGLSNQTLSGPSAVVNFNSSADVIKNIYFESPDGLIILEDGIYEATYTATANPVQGNINNISFKLLQNGRTIPGSVSFVGASSINESYQVVGGSKFSAKAGDKIQLANNVKGIIQLSKPQIVFTGAQGTGQGFGTSDEATTTITPQRDNSSIYVCTQGGTGISGHISVVDNLNNTYIQVATIQRQVDVGSVVFNQIWYTNNKGSAGSTLNITVNLSIDGIYGFEAVEVFGPTTPDQSSSGDIFFTTDRVGSVSQIINSSKNNNLGLLSVLLDSGTGIINASNANSTILNITTFGSVGALVNFLDADQILREGSNIMSIGYNIGPGTISGPILQVAALAVSINIPELESQLEDPPNNASLDIIRLG